MDRWTRFIDWCQRPSKIKIRTFNPRNAVVLVTLSIILASTITFGTWRYLAATAPPTNVSEYTYINPEDIETLTITTDTTLTEDYFGQIVIGADGVTLDGDDHMIIGPSPGIYIFDPNIEWGVTIGILLEGRTGVTIKNCHVTGFAIGFGLYDSDENTLKGNTANDNAWTGFVLSSSSNNTLLNNTANNGIEGVGFALEMSFENTLKGNTANDNYQGFSLEECNGNLFFHNTLINNTIQVGGFPGYTNTWDDDYPSGGNYWSDYEGADTNGDGIGDTPYVIDEDNVDRFPLMAPTSVFEDGT
jgi:parallel beta-helix repeat protein